MKRILPAIALLFAACGSDNAAGIDSFVRQVAEQQCSWEFRCCTDGEIKAQEGRKYATQDACVPYRQLALENDLFMSMLAARQNRLRLDHDIASACIDAMKQQTCRPKPNEPQALPTMKQLEACTGVFVGTTRAGEPCQFPMECEKGGHCVFNKATPSAGVCVPYQQEGDICNTSDDCDPAVTNLYCAQQDFRCHLRARVGEKCAYTLDGAGKPTLPLLVECDSAIGNAYCDPATSTCRQLPAAGEACLSPPPPGVTASCDPDPKLHLVCRTTSGATSGVCTGLAKSGEDCTSISCDSGLYCDTSSGSTRVCRPLPTLGMSCATAGQCALPSFCNFGKSPATCDQPAQLGQSCAAGAICDVTLWCDTTTAPSAPTCKAKFADGATCTSDAQCTSNDCSATSPRICNPTPPSAVLCVGR